MMGRPPIPIAQKRAQGDTRKLGANKFEAAMSTAWEATRGRPAMPGILRAPKRPVQPRVTGVVDFDRAADEKYTKDLANWEATRDRLKTAREHWVYLADTLEAEGLLANLDEGMLTGAALAYAMMTEAGRGGDDRAYARLWQRYIQAADRMGLNESARARLPKQAAPKMDAIESVLCG